MRNWLFSNKMFHALMTIIILLMSIRHHLANIETEGNSTSYIERKYEDKETYANNPIDTIHREEIEIDDMITSNGDKEYLFVSTADGYIHAYSGEDTDKELWKISLGKELVTTNILSSSIIEESSALIPMDGTIYLYSNVSGERNIEKFNAPIEKLIERAPFTLDFMKDYLFIGEKRSTMFTIDVEKGIILSKYSTHEDRNMINTRPIQTQNLLTVIRIDYTLICIHKDTHNQIWNVTTSEVMAIQKGSKSELSLKNKIDNQNSLDLFNPKKKELEKKLEKILDKSLLNKNSIISVHTYSDNDNTPVKIYDRDHNKEITEDEILSQFNSDDFSSHEYKLIKDYLKWKKEKLHKSFYETNMGWVSSFLLKLSEMYQFDDYFLNYCFIFLVMTGLLIFSTFLTLRYKKKNRDLKEKMKKLADENKVCRTEKNEDRIRAVAVEKEVARMEMERKENSESQKAKDSIIMDSDKADLLFSSPLDFNLNEYEQNKELKMDMKIYQDSSGSFIQEEHRTLKTKYSNHPEVEQKFRRIQNELVQNSIDRRKPRTYSFQEYEQNINNSSDQNKIEYESKRKSRSRDTKSKVEASMSIYAVKTKEETQVFLNKAKCSNEIKTNKSLANNQNSKELQLYQPGKNGDWFNKSGTVTNAPIAVSLVQRRDLSAYIDEGRLDKNFEEIEKIGQGGFGSVFKAKHRIDSCNYAIKLIQLTIRHSQHLMDHNVIKEVKTMIKLNHKNVVRYITCWFQLNIDTIASMVDQSQLVSETNTHLVSGYNLKSTREVKRFAISKTHNSLLEITENEEKTSSLVSKSRGAGQGFNWDDTKSQISTSQVEYVDKVKEEKTKKFLSIHTEDEQYIEEKISETHKEVIEITNRTIHQKDDQSYKVYFFIQMEYCDGLPLNQYIEFNKDVGLSRKLIFTFFKQIVNGVKNIHMNHIIHRDLKPHNIFIMGKESLKIGDFGLATELSHERRIKNNLSLTNLNNSVTYPHSSPQFESVKLSEMVGTPMYQSPEQIECKSYNEKVDIYAMGLILYEMCGCFKTGMERTDKITLLRNEHVIDQGVADKFPIEAELVKWMTRYKPNERPSAEEIINSELFTSLKNICENIR